MLVKLTSPTGVGSIEVPESSVEYWQALGFVAERPPKEKPAPAKRAASKKTEK